MFQIGTYVVLQVEQSSVTFTNILRFTFTFRQKNDNSLTNAGTVPTNGMHTRENMRRFTSCDS